MNNFIYTNKILKYNKDMLIYKVDIDMNIVYAYIMIFLIIGLFSFLYIILLH